MKKIDRNEQYELVNQVNALYTEVCGMYLDEQISRDELVSVQVHLNRIKRIIKNFGCEKMLNYKSDDEANEEDLFTQIFTLKFGGGKK